ncbi:MAG: type II toxin-antitoxin system VapB family antitoxin [Deltaproteobacteria bacterium]|nr:type II toxin-antitoxin system VapB family antitoxin [Deltaproteobacteria bacterium]
MMERHMRTTVVLRDDLVKRAKKLSDQKTLSGLLNACLADWIAQHSRRELKARLVEEYRSGRQESHRTSRQFAHVDKEGWPLW